MELMERIGQGIRTNLNRLIRQAEDPEVLKQAMIDIQEDLEQLRQGIALLIATQKRTERRYHKDQSDANTWRQRAQLARQKGDENMEQKALARQQFCQETAQVRQAQLERQRELVTKFQKDLVTLETRLAKVSEKIHAILGDRTLKT